MNPEGIPEGSWPRGWHPHPRIYHFERMTMPVRDFIDRFGRDAYRALPADAFLREGRRKGVRWSFVGRLA